MSGIDLEGAELEAAMWVCTNQLRWYRPKGSTDHDRVLQQLWERITGERAWRIVPYVMED